MKLAGQVALITGAGGKIGEAIALRFSREGITVALNDINLPAAERVARKVQQKGGKGFPIQGDVADHSQVQKMVDQICGRFKAIHILVNNAGLFLKGTRWKGEEVSKISAEEWNRTIAVNLSGAFYCAKCVLPLMKKQKYGNIVNVSSQAGKTGGLLNGVQYAASKAGLIGLTKGLAREAAAFNVRVNSICPGRILTPETMDVSKVFHQGVLQQIPLHRLGTVAEVADGVLFLASEASSYITGASLDVNGGWLMS